MDKNILVAVRMRPLIPREIEKNEIFWKAIPPTTITQIGSCEKPVTYNFDRVFDSQVQNKEIYSEICSDIVRSVVDGFNGTIFAYGQTASGKTYTMVGKEEKNIFGIMQYAIEDIFNLIQNMTEREFLLRVSYMEIYNETVRDLLSVSGDNLKTTEENGLIKVQNLEEKLVQKPEQILKYMKDGERRRRTGETRMNEKSSRSHAIFRMIIESCLRGVEDAAVNVSQFNLVDLAGSERVEQTGVTGQRFEESKQINKSLLSLGKVIRQLSENENQFISYRDSKLTRILQNSLGGNSLTAIICTVTAACFKETQSTLKFAERAKNITNKPTVNEVLTEQALLKKYANEIKKLTAELQATKEEKSLQNKELQEKIKNFEKLFVFQVNPSLNLVRTKSNRRETWGGTLDAARFRMEIASRNPVENQKSFSRPRVGSCNLSILEEHSEDAEAEEFFFLNQSMQQIKTAKRSSDFRRTSNSKRSSNLLGIAEAATQTEAAGLSPSPKLSESDCDKTKMMAERILHLEKELTELREFTTLEQQMMKSCHYSSNDCKVENTVSTSDEGLPGHSESFSTNFDKSIFEEMDRKNEIEEDSIFSPAHISEAMWSEKKEELFQYLETTMKIMGMWKSIDIPSVANDLKNNYRITLDMFSLILQYQCSTLKGCFKSEICKKINEVLCDLRDVFKSFSGETTSNETVDVQIKNFINKTDYLVKEIEMCCLDSDIKNELINQSRPFDSFNNLPSFEESPCSSFSRKEMNQESGMENVSVSYNTYKDGCIEENVQNSVCDCEKLKNKIIGLEKDIEEYRSSISDTNSRNEGLKNKIVALEKGLEEYKNSVSVANSSKEELKYKIATLEKDIEDYRTSALDANSRNEGLKSKILALEKGIEEYKNFVSVDNSRNEDLKYKIATLEKDIEDYRTSVLDANSRNEGLKNKIVALEKYIEEYKDSVSITKFGNEELKEKIAILEKQLKMYQTSVSNSHSENEETKVKIICLEQDLEARQETISDYKYDSELKDKQIAILKDKIEIQKQMIDSFEKEFALKTTAERKCNLVAESSTIPNKNSNSLITFKDKACQIYYMDDVSLSSGLDESNTSEGNVNNLSNISCPNCNRSVNEYSKEVCQQVLNDRPLTEPDEKNWSDQLKISFEATLKDLTELKLFTREFMKRDMKKEYLVDMDSFDEKENNYPLSDQMKVEVTALKEMLLRLEFYLQAQSETEKNLTDFLESKLVEMSILEDKLAGAESAIKSKEADVKKLECTLLNIENDVSELVQKLKSLESVEDKINYFELEDDISFVSHSNKSLNIQRMVSKLDTLINKTVSSMNDLSVKLKETQDNLTASQSRCKETKSVQTVEYYGYLELSQNLKETEASSERLSNEIKDLKSQVEILTEGKDYLQQELEKKIKFYDSRIEDLKTKFDDEKEECAKRRAKETEEKYYQMLMEQENKFLEEKHEIELDKYKQIDDCRQVFTNRIDKLQEENHKNISDLKNKLDIEIEENFKERMKLEDKIKSRERDIAKFQDYNTYLKSRCKELAIELKKHKEKAKSFEQKENVLHLQEKSREKSIDCKETQTDNYLEKNPRPSPHLCDQCKVYMEKISELEAITQSSAKKSELLFTKFQNDLEAKKAKIMSLDTNNTKMVKEIVSLKKELSSKSMLLRFCQCRGLKRKLSGDPNSEKLEGTDKDKAINLNPENDKEKPSDFRANLNSDVILQMEIVQGALKKARQEERELLLAGENRPSDSVVSHYLQAKLNKKTSELEKQKEELKSLKAELASLKKSSLKQGSDLQNDPFKNIKTVEANVFTPKTKPDIPVVTGEALHPKMLRKKVLKETNRKSIAPFPSSKEEKRKEKINDENMNPFSIPIHLEDLKTNKPTLKGQETDGKDKAAETQRQINMLFSGAPDWQWPPL